MSEHDFTTFAKVFGWVAGGMFIGLPAIVLVCVTIVAATHPGCYR